MPNRLTSCGRPCADRPGDHEIRRRLARAGKLRPDAAIVRHERACRQAGPVGADAVIEGVGPPGIDRVAFLRDPFDIGTEPHASGKVDGDVHAEPAVDRRRIDEPRKHRPAGKAEIIALGEDEAGHLVGRIALDAAGKRLSAEARGIHHGVEGDRAGVAAAELHPPLRPGKRRGVRPAFRRRSCRRDPRARPTAPA